MAGAATSIIFVATNIILSRHFVAISMLSSRQKTCFVATKMILVAAHANGGGGGGGGGGRLHSRLLYYLFREIKRA